MDAKAKEMRKYSLMRASVAIGGIVINVLLSYIMYRTGLPLYFDTVGTVGVACVCGLFPAIVTALLSNMICSLFNPVSVYFSIINIFVGFFAAQFYSRRWFRNTGKTILFIIACAVFGGVVGSTVQQALLGHGQFEMIDEAAGAISIAIGISNNFASVFINIGLNLVDKGVSTAIALTAVHFLPKNRIRAILDSGWRQEPLSRKELKELRSKGAKKGHSLRVRISVMLLVTALTLTVVIGWIGLKHYYDNTKEEYIMNASNAANFAASIIDPDMLEAYMQNGREVPGYEETERTLYSIRDFAAGVKYLYVYIIKSDGCYVAFDLDSDDMQASEPGTRLDFEKAFTPYLPALLVGEPIEPVVSNDISGWVITVYVPIINSTGRTVGYAGADVSMNYLSNYVQSYLLKSLLVFSGFFVAVLAYGMWVSEVFLVYPIDSMSACADGFMHSSGEQSSLDQLAAKLKKLDIRTDDEVEMLYHALCGMATETTERMRDIRHYSDATAKMQNGLIITMADMVENRDSDTGAHIQKTAEYVRIILNGLRDKQYYIQKLTPKYMSDVIMSAPLHDVGKINIPDTVLNKPGKLTDEEFEIMKTHTTAGKKIMERAISTLSGENYLKEARNMAAYHHERWDGKGYPEGLAGEVIPLSARIMAVADVFDALVSPRVYKPAFPVEKALQIIREGSGTQFDPKCVEVFMDALPEVMVVLKRYHGDHYA